MLSRAEALDLVIAYLEARSEAGELAVLEDETLEYEFGWVFFYNSEAYVRSGDFRDALVGNAPIIVDRSSGELLETGTAEPIEVYVEAFRRFGDPHGSDSNN